MAGGEQDDDLVDGLAHHEEEILAHEDMLVRAPARQGESVANHNRAPYSGRMPVPPRPADDRDMGNSIRAVRAVSLVAVLAAAVLVGARPAAADEPGESTVASELVRQAIALIVNTPGNMEAAEEKIGDALEVDNREGVDIPLVRQADEALAAGDLHEASAVEHL
jgi:hypothetical protein